MKKRQQITCRCPAYPFPHREGGGQCEMPDWCGEISRDWADCLTWDEYSNATLCNDHYIIKEATFNHRSLIFL
jgi:hypothetical protein